MENKCELRNVHKHRMSEVQRCIGEWAERTFGVPPTLEDKRKAICRMEEEVEELLEELKIYEMYTKQNIAPPWQIEDQLVKVRTELADVIITAMSTMYPLEIDVLDDVLAKQEVNESRKWLQNYDRPGTGRHVKTEEDLKEWKKRNPHLADGVDELNSGGRG